MPVLKGYIKCVAVGKKPISAIFTPAQMKFLEKTAGHKIDFASTRAKGRTSVTLFLPWSWPSFN